MNWKERETPWKKKFSVCVCVCVCARAHTGTHTHTACTCMHACTPVHTYTHMRADTELEVADPIELELQALGSCKPLNIGAGAHSLPLIYLSSPEKPIFLRNSASVSSANISQYSLYCKHPREFQGFVGAL